MKKLITIIILLIINVFIVISTDTLDAKIVGIERQHSEISELKKWLYVKKKVFDDKGKIQKNYNKPIRIRLGKYTTKKDSLLIDNIIEYIQELVPIVDIDFESNTLYKSIVHVAEVDFKKDSMSSSYYRVNKTLPNGGIVRTDQDSFSDYNYSFLGKYSMLNFEFDKNTSDEERKNYITVELLRKFFSTRSMEKYDATFGWSVFNEGIGYQREYSNYYIVSEFDKFLLQKLYASDFKSQFKTYMRNYPLLYRIFFLDQENYSKKALFFV